MKITAQQLRDLSEKELETLLGESQEMLRKLNFDAASAQLKQNHKITETRRKIARIKSVLAERIEA